MKVTKATKQDVDAIFDIISLLDAVQDGEIPNENEESDPQESIGTCALFEALDATEEEYVSNKVNHFIRQALKRLISIHSSAYPMLAAMNLSCFLEPSNEIIDPENDTLEFHPKIHQAMLDSERLEWFFKYGTSKSTKEFALGKDVNFENFREKIDAAMEIEKLPKP
jgi:hypothetical protein|nr:MAG TPA: hypothetical protein [Bacteriophage sp.]